MLNHKRVLRVRKDSKNNCIKTCKKQLEWEKEIIKYPFDNLFLRKRRAFMVRWLTYLETKNEWHFA